MTTERFSALLFGPLGAPTLVGQVRRLTLALKYVVDGCGKQGADMLEAWCQAREEQDHQDAFSSNIDEHDFGN